MERGPSNTLSAFRLDGRTAVVTGAGGLLGGEFARALAEAGARVHVADTNAETLGSAVERLAGLGHAVQAHALDVTSVESVKAVTDAIARNDGRMDVLVNAAAIDPKFDPAHRNADIGSFEGLSLERWNRSLSVNLTGVFLCCQAVVPVMRSRGTGSIVNICSTYGLVGPDQRIYQAAGQAPRFKPADYSVTKAGVLGLTRYLAAYLAGTAVRVNCLTPGGVFLDHEDDFVERYAARTVLGRMARRDELNGALLFLASDASSYMTGANLVVDGGWTAW
jgi:NAD(P)-dependent dehydrogenase (short-subunit alcohol dehydrogenase family)